MLNINLQPFQSTKYWDQNPKTYAYPLSTISRRNQHKLSKHKAVTIRKNLRTIREVYSSKSSKAFVLRFSIFFKFNSMHFHFFFALSKISWLNKYPFLKVTTTILNDFCKKIKVMNKKMCPASRNRSHAFSPRFHIFSSCRGNSPAAM